MMLQVTGSEVTEFWRWLGNGTVAITGYFLLQIVRVQRVHGTRLNNHAQRLAKLDNETERGGTE